MASHEDRIFPIPRERHPASLEGRHQKQYENLNSLLNSALIKDSSGPINLAAWSDGEAEATVSLQGTDSCWGSFKQERAVVLYFCTSRREPRGFRLSSLRTELSISDQDPQTSFPLLGAQSLSKAFILDRPAPVNVIPKGASWQDQQECWRYSSFLPGKGSRLTKAIWDFENGIGSRNLGDLHGGLLVRHQNEPIYIYCKLEGRLVAGASNAWTIGRRILRFLSREPDGLELSTFRLVPVIDREHVDISEAAARLQREVEARIHGLEARTEHRNARQLKLDSRTMVGESNSVDNVAQDRSLAKSIDDSLAQLRTGDYPIAIVCALPKEFKAVRSIFDFESSSPSIDSADTNSYVFGSIAGHNVVAVCLPSNLYGNCSATEVITQMQRSFSGIEFFLLVGIGAAIWSSIYDIRLGDVVVSDNGIVKHDFKKVLGNGLSQHIGHLNAAPLRLRKAISNMLSNKNLTSEPLRGYLENIAAREQEYCYPIGARDDLFVAGYSHVSPSGGNGSCEDCEGELVSRLERSSTHPIIHYGTIASGDQLIKDPYHRDEIGDRHNAICIEMEGAGIATFHPCLSIRGISDYSDTHKNDAWQKYACATAAAYTKLLLSQTRPFGLDLIGKSSSSANQVQEACQKDVEPKALVYDTYGHSFLV